ncbi:hypothetical protein T492DRAFT_976902 [Pavlovales sp. CCMP2436]|nr:hypothetical protein T492DRAFT_976902 [Pavlovales sp. CCMP2436]
MQSSSVGRAPRSVTTTSSSGTWQLRTRPGTYQQSALNVSTSHGVTCRPRSSTHSAGARRSERRG